MYERLRFNVTGVSDLLSLSSVAPMEIGFIAPLISFLSHSLDTSNNEEW